MPMNFDILLEYQSRYSKSLHNAEMCSKNNSCCAKPHCANHYNEANYKTVLCKDLLYKNPHCARNWIFHKTVLVQIRTVQIRAVQGLTVGSILLIICDMHCIQEAHFV